MRFIENTFVRRARKQYKCGKCKSAIIVGEEYAEYVGEVGPYESGVRYCLTCASTQFVDTGR
jgi:peptide methionine sulfoxide reductase MsrB